MLYVCTKFLEIISKGTKVIERTQFLYGKLQREKMEQKVEQLLLISACRLVMLFICAMFHEIISNGIKVIE